MNDRIRVVGARTHNLRGIDVDVPHRRLTAVTGVSGSGKSSFAFDTLFREGERRYLATLASAARLLTGKLERPEVESIRGLGPAVAVSQHLGAANPRSTVGTATGLWDLVRLLFARLAARHCPTCAAPVDDVATVCKDGHPVPRRQRSLLSFNDPEGACPACTGLGVVDRVDPDLIVADPSKSIRAGALVPTLKNGYTVYSQVTVDVMNDICRAHGFDVDTPWAELSDAQRQVILHGTTALVVPFGKHSLESRLKWAGITAKPREEGYYRGLVPVIEETLQRNRNDNILRFVRSEPCEACGGSRLGPAARALRLGTVAPQELTEVPLRDLVARIGSPVATGALAVAAAAIHDGLERRARVLVRLGLGHLPLGRGAPSLSTGERQRIRLAQQLDDDLSGLTYVLDEPSVDLHPSSRHELQAVLRSLVHAGNTVLTVEHDPTVVAQADHVIELGPGPGVEGGRLLFDGPPAGLADTDTATGRALSAAPAPLRSELPDDAPKLWVREPRARNLRGDDVPLALGALNVVTGVSGAGKSTLVRGVLAPAVERALGRAKASPGAHEGLEGHEALRHVITLDQRPIGRTPRSNPATYTGLFDVVRKAFAKTERARNLGFQASRFSFNTAGGRCPGCEGAGVTRVPMHGLGDVSVTCPRCDGRRFDDETLSVKLAGLDVAEVLALEVREAQVALAEFEAAQPVLEALTSVGLGYLSLGQPATDLSGGEAQRVRLATELAKPVSGAALYVLDEPTKGLHPADLAPLLDTLSRLTARGHTLVVVEHDPLVWRAADWLIDLGPGGGDDGGALVFAGPPRRLSAHPTSKTAAILRGEYPAVEAARAAAARAPSVELLGVRTHNLKGIDVSFPRDALSVVTGPSGSGKTSLAFDTLAAEAMARLTGRLGAHVRRRIRRLPRPELESATGLTPTVALRQRPAPAQPRSTVGTQTEVQDLLRLLFSRLGTPRGRPAAAFSFNAEAGACPTCTGLGFTLAGDERRLVTDPDRPVLDGACRGTKIGRRFTEANGQHAATLMAAAARADVDLSGPFEALPPATRALVLRGDGGPEMTVVWRFKRGARTGEHTLRTPWIGLLGLLEDEYDKTHLGKGAGLVELMKRVRCRACDGGRLGPRALEVTVAGEDLGAVSARPSAALLDWLDALQADLTDPRDAAVLAPIAAELRPRLDALVQLGLGHLHPHRGADTLSNGERTRVALAAQIGAPMTGATFVLDEPTRGLHPSDVGPLFDALGRLVGAANTVIVVEHGAAARARADHLVVLGPGGGPDGGSVVYAGPPGKAPPLARGAPAKPLAVEPGPPIRVRGAARHNLRGFDLDLPGAGLTAIAGPSGSGKSTLVRDELLLAPQRVSGLERFSSLEWLDATPLAGGWASVVAGAVGVFEPLRRHFASSAAAKAAKLGRSAFGFTQSAGRCPTCKGTGRVTVALDFIADARAACEACGGQRYRPEVLACCVDGRSIAQALDLNVAAALEVFADEPDLRAPLEHLAALGLDHLTLGRAAPTLSGGEAQRVRLAGFLAAPPRPPALFLLDEPTVGIDEADGGRVQGALQALIRAGHAVIVISHDLELVAAAHHVVELGPGGGPRGGAVVFEGTPEALAAADTATGRAFAARSRR